jgi:hypothetical protein
VEPETIIRTTNLDDAIFMLEDEEPGAEQLSAMSRAMGEDEYCVFLDEASATAYIAGPAWWESAVQPGEGECDTYTVEKMPAARLLTLKPIADAVEAARNLGRQNADLQREADQVATLAAANMTAAEQSQP